MKIFVSKIIQDGDKLIPGSIEICGDKMYIGATDGKIMLLEIQMQGKKRMSIADFLRGA